MTPKSITTSLLVVFIILLFPIIAGSGVLYLKNGKAIPNAKDIQVKGQYIHFTVDGKQFRLRANDIKEIEWVANEVRKGSAAPSYQTQKPTTRVKKSYSQPNPIAMVPRSQAKADIKANLARRYAGSYNTQKMLLDANMRNYEYLISLPPNKINNQILSNLKRRYYPSFSTIKMLYESNIKSYRELQE